MTEAQTTCRQKPGRLRFTLHSLAALLLLAGNCLQAAVPERLLADFDQAKLLVEIPERGCVLFDVYVAVSPEQLTQGLMRIRYMPKYEGMIFLYPAVRPVSMWMKNTFIPLDMLFVGEDNTVADMHRSAVPESEAIISSRVPAAAVIELNAGSIDAFGISQGSRIRFPFR